MTKKIFIEQRWILIESIYFLLDGLSDHNTSLSNPPNRMSVFISTTNIRILDYVGVDYKDDNFDICWPEHSQYFWQVQSLRKNFIRINPKKIIKNNQKLVCSSYVTRVSLFEIEWVGYPVLLSPQNTEFTFRL